MTIRKVSWSNSADKVKFTIPLSKIDEEKRQVSGFASLDNDDQHGDIVLADASSKAFSRFRGNIREMHQPIAVGKMVDFKEEEYFDSNSGNVYKGIYVTVRVSKGAQDTWEKVLDGTLTGFSIGGHITDSEQTIVKNDSGKEKSIRIIKEYEIEELSLVDNPANQLANVFSIQKNSDGQVTGTGILLEKSSEVVYYCKQDGIAKTSPEDSAVCPDCGESMQDAGWIEYTSKEERLSKFAERVASFNSQEGEATPAEGGVQVGDIEKNVTQPNEESSDIPVAEQGKAQTEVDSSVEEVSEVEGDDAANEEEVNEVQDETDELSKMLDSLREDIVGNIEKNFDAINNKVESVNKSFEEFGKNIEEKFRDLESKHGELSKRLAVLKDEFETVEKSVRKIEGSTAVRKSGDSGGSSEKVIQRSGDDSTFNWKGTFFGPDFIE